MAAAENARIESLKDYTSLRRYTLVNKRFKTTAELRVRMNYRHPGEKTIEVISETGSSIIRKSVLHRLIKTELDSSRAQVRNETRISPANYTFQLLGVKTDESRWYYLLQAEPKHPSKVLFRGQIWIDPEDYAIARVEGSPAQNASFFIQKTTFVHEYRKFGAYWLPVSNKSETETRFFGPTEVNVEYTDYKINTDLASGAGTVGGK